MGRSVALVRFDVDGADMYCVYCHTTDLIVSRELYDTADMARAALDAREAAYEGRGVLVEQRQEPSGVMDTQEPVKVYPYWRYDDMRFNFRSHASRGHRWLTGPRGLDDMPRESRSEGWF